jgi:hydroxymethylglutaryl-CoA lyase
LVEICEVAPRDGLQNEATLVSTHDKLRLIEALVEAGVKRIEATSFVHPGRVPQMADAEAVMAGVPRDRGVRWAGLALNIRGVARAIAAGCDEVAFAFPASEAFCRRNQGHSVAEGLRNWAEAAPIIRAAGRIPTLTIATAFGCPFEGPVDPASVVRIAAAVAESGPAEISLADTIGVATPDQVGGLFLRVAQAAPGVALRAHFHNTRNTGYANAYAALKAGVSVLDSSAGGIGGCPFAPRATGNIATADLLFMLDGMGVPHGIDRARMAALDEVLAHMLGHPVPGLLGRTDAWPPVAAMVG